MPKPRFGLNFPLRHEDRSFVRYRVKVSGRVFYGFGVAGLLSLSGMGRENRDAVGIFHDDRILSDDGIFSSGKIRKMDLCTSRW
jgi:hypothetical protein